MAGSTRKRRVRYGQLPNPQAACVPYAKSREELAGLTEAQIVQLVVGTDAWARVMRPACEEIDQRRSFDRRGRKRREFLYTSEELEIVHLFGRLVRAQTHEQTRATIAGDNSEIRATLGFDTARNDDSRRRRMNRRDGVPSTATMCRHRKRMTTKRRAELYREMFHLLVEEHLQFHDFLEQLLDLHVDGSAKRTKHVCEIRDHTGRVVNEKRVTCRDGGYVPHKAGEHKAGHGFTMFTASASANFLPVSVVHTPLSASDGIEGARLLREDFAQRIGPHLAGKVGVVTADSGFTGSRFRMAAREMGYVENAHPISHANRPKSKERASRATGTLYPIQGYPN